MSFTMILSVGERGEIGAGGELAFHIKADLKFFRRITLDHPVIMGLLTWQSLPQVLDRREHFVIARPNEIVPPKPTQTNARITEFTPNSNPQDIKIVRDLHHFITACDPDQEYFIIGGASIYQQFLPYVDKIYLTQIHATNPQADRFFHREWLKEFSGQKLHSGKERGVKFEHIIYTRKEQHMSNTQTDPIFNLIAQEEQRQGQGLELIPSENHVSRAVLSAMGSVLTNKYSEGYPNFANLDLDSADLPRSEKKISQEILPNYRYYGGQVNIDRIERLAIARAKALFGADHANVQPHSGANANEAVYFAWCQPGDKILGMDLAHGGHLTHGAPVTRSAKIYQFINYHTDANGDIDYTELEQLALKEKPKIILVGYSAFTKIPDFTRVAKIGQRIGALLMADMAHVAGLIAGGQHPNPLQMGFHVMTTTTHKTLRGPRGGLILSMGKVSNPLKKPEHTIENIPTLIDRAVFPGTQGGPLENQIAAKAVAFGEALSPDFSTYAKQVVENAKILATALQKYHFKLVGNGTENHLILADMKQSFGIDGKFYEIALDQVGITLNANALPGSKGAAFAPDGVRLGTPAITSRGMGKAEMLEIADCMHQVALICQKIHKAEDITRVNSDKLDKLADHHDAMTEIAERIRKIALAHPLPHLATNHEAL